MANKKISQLPEAEEITADDIVPIVEKDSLQTQQATFQKVLDYVTGSTFQTITANNYVGIRESMILPNFDLSSFSFTSGTGNPVEVGTEKNNITFSATANRTPTYAVLQDSYGSPDTNLTPQWVEPNTSISFGVTGNFVKNDTNQSISFTLTAEEGGISKNRTVSTIWTRYFYWGKSSNSSLPLTEANVKSLGNSSLNTSKSRTFSVTMSSEYAYFAYPTSYGQITGLKDNNAGFPTGFTLVGTVSSVTTENGNGNSTNYYLYRTSNALQGTISFTTS